jgi:hypothetical protein
MASASAFPSTTWEREKKFFVPVACHPEPFAEASPCIFPVFMFSCFSVEELSFSTSQYEF